MGGCQRSSGTVGAEGAASLTMTRRWGIRIVVIETDTPQSAEVEPVEPVELPCSKGAKMVPDDFEVPEPPVDRVPRVPEPH